MFIHFSDSNFLVNICLDLLFCEIRRNAVEWFVFGLAEGEACQDEWRLADVSEADFAVANGRLTEIRVDFRNVFFLRKKAGR